MQTLTTSATNGLTLLPEKVDHRSLCFEADSNANFVIHVSGALRHCNDAARAMLAAGLIQLDRQERLCVAGGAGRQGAVALTGTLPSYQTVQIRQISQSRWLVAAVRTIPGLPDTLHVRAREIRLDGNIDLKAIAEELGISDSETPVLQGLAQAICPKEISRSLGLSIHTIRSHLRSIYAKLGVRTAAEVQLRVLQIYFTMKAIN